MSLFNGYQLQELRTVEDCKRILSIINRRNSGKAVVAGGWVRDKLNGIEPKDMDIFVMSGNRDLIEHDLELNGFYGNARYFGNYENCDMRDDVEGVLQYHRLGMDIVFMEQFDIEEVVENFDVSVCQIWAELEDDSLVVYASRDYMDYKERGIIYQYSDIPTTDDHLNRIRAKYGTELTQIKSHEVERVRIGVLNE